MSFFGIHIFSNSFFKINHESKVIQFSCVGNTEKNCLIIFHTRLWGSFCSGAFLCQRRISPPYYYITRFKSPMFKDREILINECRSGNGPRMCWRKRPCMFFGKWLLAKRLVRRVFFAGCRLKFNYNWKTAGT